MSKMLKEIAEQLRGADKKVQLIYAFNGSGKTRLSREFKELVSPKNENGDDAGEEDLPRNKILYYNAYTEDLFYWNNDLELDAEPKLKIQPNSFTDWVLIDQGQDQNIIANFQRYANPHLMPRFNSEYTVTVKDDIGLDKEKIIKAFSEVTFSFQFDQLEYVFIDDPVSSLDENHLIQLAVNLGQLIKSSKSDIKFIISTHNPLFYNVLYNELGVKAGYILSRFDDGTFELEEKRGDSNKSFAYHLHIKNLIQQAIDENSVQRYHFALLRNLYEKTSSFLGYQRWSDLLPGDKKAYASRIMNFYPHSSLSNEQISEPTAPEKAMVGLLLENLNNYGYWQQEEENG